MPVIRGEDVAIKTPFLGFDMQLMVNRADGSQTIIVISEALHPGGRFHPIDIELGGQYMFMRGLV